MIIFICSEFFSLYCHNTVAKTTSYFHFVYSQIGIETTQFSRELSELVRELLSEQLVFNFDLSCVCICVSVQQISSTKSVTSVSHSEHLKWFHLDKIGKLPEFECFMSQSEVFDKISVHVPEISWLKQ